MTRGKTNLRRKAQKKVINDESYSGQEEEEANDNSLCSQKKIIRSFSVIDRPGDDQSGNNSEQNSPASSERSYQHQNWNDQQKASDSDQAEDSYDAYRDEGANIGFQGKKDEDAEAKSVSGGHVSDGVNFDDIDAEMDRVVQVKDHNQKNTSQHYQNGHHRAQQEQQQQSLQQSRSRQRRQASLIGHKRVHKTCRRERRRNLDGSSGSDGDFFDDDESEADVGDIDNDDSDRAASQRDSDGSSNKYKKKVQQRTDTKLQKEQNDFIVKIAGEKNLPNKNKNQKSAQINHYVDKYIVRQDHEVDQHLKDEARQREDEKIRGSFKINQVREVKALIGYDEIISKRQSNKFMELMCLVSWWPSKADPFTTPMDTEESYNEVREQAPELVVDYFIKRTILE